MKDGIRRIWRRGNVAFFSLVLGGLLVLLGWWIGWSAGNSAVVSSTHPAVATSPPSTLPSSLDWTRDLLSIVLSWPVVVLLILGSLMVSGAAAHRMSRVLSGFRSVKLPGGIEVVLSEGGYVNRCVNDIRRRPSQPLSQRRSHPRIERRDRRLRSTQGPSDA